MHHSPPNLDTLDSTLAADAFDFPKFPNGSHPGDVFVAHPAEAAESADDFEFFNGSRL